VEIVHLRESKFLIVIDYNVARFDGKNLVSSEIFRLEINTNHENQYLCNGTMISIED
jgi:hypothetical protein